MNKTEFRKESAALCEQLNFLHIKQQAEFAAHLYSLQEKLIQMNGVISTEDFIHCGKKALAKVLTETELTIKDVHKEAV